MNNITLNQFGKLMQEHQEIEKIKYMSLKLVRDNKEHNEESKKLFKEYNERRVAFVSNFKKIER